MKFATGQKVLVTSAPAGIASMEKFIGKVVTISKVDDIFYFIEEAPVWVWRDHHFAKMDKVSDPNVLFMMRRET